MHLTSDQANEKKEAIDAAHAAMEMLRKHQFDDALDAICSGCPTIDFHAFWLFMAVFVVLLPHALLCSQPSD